MSTVEVLDSLGAIGAAHGVDGSETALHALHAAHRELRPRDRKLTGSVQLEISRAGISNVQVEYGTA
jgi:hypothetical protein